MRYRLGVFSDHSGRWISIVFFISAITLPLAGHVCGFFDESYIVSTEKRQPNPFPDRSGILEDPEGFISSLESYINDHYGFREKLTRLNSIIRFELGMSLSEKVTAGRDGWLFYSENRIIDQYRGIDRFSEDEINSWVRAAVSRHRWLAERGIGCLFVFLPEKSTVYPEYLPGWVTIKGQRRLEQLKDRLQNSGLNHVDVTSEILDAKKNSPVYFMTDSHWNFHGGFAGYTVIMKEVRKFYPDLKTLAPNDVELGYRESGDQDLSRMLNLSGYLIDINADFYVLKKPSKVILSESFNKNEKLPLLVRTSLKNAPRVIIIRDSFTDFMEPYLNETFSEILYLSHGNRVLDEETVLKFKPDIVIHAMIERILIVPMYGLSSGGRD